MRSRVGTTSIDLLQSWHGVVMQRVCHVTRASLNQYGDGGDQN
jgi:hypothetical protein